jgi:hypothetical protein
MIRTQRAARRGAATFAILATLGAATACGNTAGLGNILGSVLGGGGAQGSQLAGTVQGVDTRNQQIGIQQQNGQTVAVAYDNQTRVIYQNQVYNVTSLDPGDQVTARVQSANNGAYYTDSIWVTQPVGGSAGTGGTGGNTASGSVQSLQGVVRQIDQSNGWFSLDLGSSGTVTVSLPYNVGRSDLTRFQQLRTGDQARIYGVFLNNSRVELRQFY